MTINADHVTVESGGLIDASGGGYPAGQGPGQGAGNVGGSHASSGGNAPQDRQYNSLYWPLEPGSGGGYGAGGGWLHIDAGTYVAVDGVIRSNGVGLSSSSSGGGSGGAIVVKTLFLRGYGTIESHGGRSKCVLVLSYLSFCYGLRVFVCLFLFLFLFLFLCLCLFLFLFCFCFFVYVFISLLVSCLSVFEEIGTVQKAKAPRPSPWEINEDNGSLHLSQLEVTMATNTTGSSCLKCSQADPRLAHRCFHFST